MRVILLILIAILLGTSHQSKGQGCSDAGFCTMGAMRPNQAYSKKLRLKLRSLEYNFYRGTSLLTPIIYAHTLEFNAALGDKINLQAKVPYMIIKGSLGENEGVGDISLSATRNISHGKKWSVDGTIGMKLPSNNSNGKVANEFSSNVEVPLHMYYQTSLGSIDAIAGISMMNAGWMFATGIQLALTENENLFRWSDWPEFPDQNYVQRYNVGRNLKRGTDVMLRIERRFRFTNFDFSIGLLPIFRISKDEVYIPATDSRVKLDGTTGMALSALGSMGYSFNVKNGIRLIYGRKITNREINPDGLTRHDVMSFSYVYRF